MSESKYGSVRLARSMVQLIYLPRPAGYVQPIALPGADKRPMFLCNLPRNIPIYKAKVHYRMNPITEIPLIDFQPFLAGNARDRKSVASAIDNALSSVGFIYISNHGIKQSKVDECFNWSERFFALPEATKKMVQHTPERLNRGYSGIGEEHVRQTPSKNETFKCGNPKDADAQNVWLPDEKLPGFRDFMEDFYQDCTQLIYQLLDCLAIALDLEDVNMLRRHHVESLFNLDLLHYPSLPVQSLEPGGSARMPAHSDFGSLTLLFQDSAGGLEAADLSTGDAMSSEKFDQTGSFRKVEPKAGTAVVNVGYLLMRWSNGRWKNTIHRVVDPSVSMKRRASNEPLKTQGDGSEVGEAMTQERFSIPFFAAPDPATMVEALPGCWSDENPKRWKPINAGDYLQRKKKAIYL